MSDNLTRGERMVLIAGGVLALDLIFFPWHQGTVVTVFGPARIRLTAIEAPNAFYGIVALILTVAMVLRVIVSKMTSARLPDLPVSWGQVQFITGVAIAALLVVKLVAETTAIGVGALLAIPVAGVLAYGAYLLYQESRTGGTPRSYGGY